MKTNNFNIKTILIVFVLGMSFLSFSQDKKAKREERQDKVKNLKIAYFTKELNLSTNESEKFWPIYNEMEEKMKNIRKGNKKSIDQLQENSESMSDDDFKKSMNQIFDTEMEETNVKKEYYNKMAGAIGYKKAGKVYRLEREFKVMLLKEMKDGQRGPKPQRPPHQE